MLRITYFFLLFLSYAFAESSITFCSWNLQNYFLTQPTAPNGEVLDRAKLKPQAEQDAVLKTLKQLTPDIIRISEIGRQGELQMLQKQLAAQGLDYPYLASATGSDLYRSLGLLSKFPITQTRTPEKLTFHTGYQLQTIRRGFLSTEIATPLGSIHFLGCHLKSKRPSTYDDSNKIRYGEALRLRDHILQLFQENPTRHLITYGDFNDTRSSPVITLIGGKPGHPQRLTKLSLKSPDHTYWTHHWKTEDVYSRFDYIFLSPSLKDFYHSKQSRIASDTSWFKASDHRPLFLTLKEPSG